MPKTSVIIPVWCNDEETWQITNACIDSFRAAGEVELILVDNASKVGGGWLRKCSDVYVRFPENRGYTVAVNAGLKLVNTNSSYIFLANNDIRVPSNLLTVCEGLLQDPGTAFVYPKMIDYTQNFTEGGSTYFTGKERWCGNSLLGTTGRTLGRLLKEELNPQMTNKLWNGREPYPGLFDENYGIGGGADDWDFSHRVRQIGRQVFTSKTQFQHLNSFSLKKLGPERQKIVDQNNTYFVKKWGMTKEELFTKDLPGQMEQNYYEVLKSL